MIKTILAVLAQRQLTSLLRWLRACKPDILQRTQSGLGRTGGECCRPGLHRTRQGSGITLNIMKRVMQTMLQMKKIDIEKLKQALMKDDKVWGKSFNQDEET